MEYLKRERGEEANRALEKVKKIFGNPIVTDKPRPYPKMPPKPDDLYWVFVCPKCKGRMHAAYFTVKGVRYMCTLCGNLYGDY